MSFPSHYDGDRDVVRAVCNCMRDAIRLHHNSIPDDVFVPPSWRDDVLHYAFLSADAANGFGEPYPHFVRQLPMFIVNEYRGIHCPQACPHHLAATIMLARLERDQRLFELMRGSCGVLHVLTRSGPDADVVAHAARRAVLPLHDELRVLWDHKIESSCPTPAGTTGVVVSCAGDNGADEIRRRLGTALSVGGPVIITSGSELPPDVAARIDRQMVMPPLDADTVAEVVSISLGVGRDDPIEEIAAEDCSGLFLDDLRLIIRPEVTVRETHLRLRRLIAARAEQEGNFRPHAPG